MPRSLPRQTEPAPGIHASHVQPVWPNRIMPNQRREGSADPLTAPHQAVRRRHDKRKPAPRREAFIRLALVATRVAASLD